MINLKYPLLLVHGAWFRDADFFGYWGRIPKVLEKAGCKVYLSNTDGNASVEDNGKFLCKRIKQIIDDSGAEKLNVIAFSKGGLDIRYAVSSLGMDKYVASVSTISTPHNGSYTMDRLLKKYPLLLCLGAALSDLFLIIVGDKKPDGFKLCWQFTTEGAAKFNRENPDKDGVYYQSFAFVFKKPYSDPLMFPFYNYIKRVEGENDGLVTPRNAAHGNFRGVYKSVSDRGISHIDEIDFRRRPLTTKKGKGISDITRFYLALATDLQKRGF